MSKLEVAFLIGMVSMIVMALCMPYKSRRFKEAENEINVKEDDSDG